MPQPHTKTLVFASIIAVLVLGFAFVFAPSIVARIFNNDSQAALQELRTAGAENFGTGNYDTARANFEQARGRSVLGDQRAEYELLIAATYETSDLSRSTDLYLQIINNATYSPVIRSYAAAYLLLALSNQYNPTVAARIFSSEPWVGYVDTSITSNRLRYELALARGHEWALEMNPNFLSYLIAGEIYARSYPRLSVAQQKDVLGKISSYYARGDEAFAAAVANPSSHPNVISTGYLIRAAYAEQLVRLAKNKTITDSGLTRTDVDALYDVAETYVQTLPSSPFKNIMAFTAATLHAGVVTSIGDQNKLAKIGDRIATLIVADDTIAQAAHTYGSAQGGALGERRSALIAGAKVSSALKAALLSHTTSFTAKDFASQ